MLQPVGIEEDPYEAWAKNCIDIFVLEEAISKLRLFGGEKEFNKLLEDEVAKCDRFYNGTIQKLVLKNYPTSDTSLKIEVPEQLTRDILRLEDFVKRNIEHLLNILRMHDETSDFSITPSFQWKLQRNGFCSPEAMEGLLMRLSSQYFTLYQRNKKPALQEEAKGVASTHFERKSIKFWIRSEDVAKVVCETVKNLPIYSFGKLNRFSQHTTSVYYDDDALSMYALRLVKEENSTLIRFRWYNDMQKDTLVFVERKVHHESWVMANSNKMRFTLPQEHILGFVQGTYQPTQEFIAKHPMFVDVQQMIINDGLQPCLQTRYNRSAFQMDDDDSIRLSLDTSLMMCRESGVDIATDWRKREHAYLEKEVHRFPFAVLEIKLHTHVHPPGWVQNLMTSGLLIRVDKFSKYSHGVAWLYPNMVKSLPYWLDEKFSADVNNNQYYDSDDDNEYPTPKQEEQLPLSTPNKAKGSIYNQLTGNTLKGKPDRMADNGDKKNPFKNLATKIKRYFKNQPEAPTKPRIESRLRIEPKTFFANERTYLQWFNAATVIGSVSIAMLGTESSQTMGLVFLPLAVLITIYALVVYHWRTEKLIRRDPSATYSDKWGPTALTVVFLTVLFISVFRAVYSTYPATVVMPASVRKSFSNTLKDHLARCDVSYALSKPPQAEFLPSGAVYLGDRLFVSAADGRIAELDLEAHTSTVWTELWLPPVGPLHLEALAVVPVPVPSPPNLSASSSASRSSIASTFSSATVLGEATEEGEEPAFLYAALEMPALIVELEVSSRNDTRTINVTRIFDVSELVVTLPEQGVDGLTIVPSANKEGCLVYVASQVDGALSVMELPLASSSNSTVALLRHRFFPFRDDPNLLSFEPPIPTTNTRSTMPKPNMNPALPPGMGGMGPAGAGFGAASGAAAPAAKPTTPKIVIQYSSGQLFVHSVQQQMLKVYDLGPDGMPKNLEVYKAHSLAVEGLEAFVVKPTAADATASSAATTFVAAGTGFVEMRLGQDGFEFCEVAVA